MRWRWNRTVQPCHCIEGGRHLFGTFHAEKFGEAVPELGFELSALSVMMLGGTPKRDIHPLMKAFATDSAVMSDRGMASGQRVNRSMQVRRYV